MASIKIDNDRIKDRGDAQDFLRELVQQIGLGYSVGPGWVFEDGYVKEPEQTIKCGGCDAIAKNGEGEEAVLHRQECSKYDPEATRKPKDLAEDVGGAKQEGRRFPWEREKKTTVS